MAVVVVVDKISGGKAEQITDDRGVNLNVVDVDLLVSIDDRQNTTAAVYAREKWLRAEAVEA